MADNNAITSIIEPNKTYCEDCIDYLRDMIKAGIKVDCAIIDEPYGIDYYTNFRKKHLLKTQDGIENDKNNLHFLGYVTDLIFSVMKDNSHIYWFSRWDTVGKHKELLEYTGFQVKNVLIWVKNNWNAGDLYGSYSNQYECIIFAQKGRKELNDGRHPDVLFFDRVSGNELLHNHQKPINLIEFLIKKSSNPGDFIIDPFTGSGTVPVACRELDRNFYACEKEQDTYAIADKRLSQRILEFNKEQRCKNGRG